MMKNDQVTNAGRSVFDFRFESWSGSHIGGFTISTALCLLFCLTIVHIAFAIGGVDSAPPPSAPHVTKFAEPRETRLANGLRVIVAERPQLPLLAAQLLVRHGAEVDPAKLAGTASMAASLLTKGSENLSAPEIANAIESLGGSIESGADWDASGGERGRGCRDNADPALLFVADVVRHPVFKQ